MLHENHFLMETALRCFYCGEHLVCGGDFVIGFSGSGIFSSGAGTLKGDPARPVTSLQLNNKNSICPALEKPSAL